MSSFLCLAGHCSDTSKRQQIARSVPTGNVIGALAYSFARAVVLYVRLQQTHDVEPLFTYWLAKRLPLSPFDYRLSGRLVPVHRSIARTGGACAICNRRAPLSPAAAKHAMITAGFMVVCFSPGMLGSSMYVCAIAVAAYFNFD